MSVWYMFPTMTEKAAQKTIALWKSEGYRVAVLTEERMDVKQADIHILTKDFRNWGHAQNKIMKKLLTWDRSADFFIAGSDDIEPHQGLEIPKVIEELKQEYGEDLYCVMQPIGDPYGGINHCAPHPWIGRGWAKKQFPLCPLYHHLYVDQELKDVAEAEGAFCTRSDIIQVHKHWGRDGCSDFLPEERRMAIKRHRLADKKLYDTRKAKRLLGIVRAYDPITGHRFAKEICGVHFKSISAGAEKIPAYAQTQFVSKHLSLFASNGTDRIVLHNSDKSTTDSLVQSLPDNVKKVFAVNCTSSKATALPLGLLNSDEVLDYLRFTTYYPKRLKGVYLNAPFNSNNQRKATERKCLYEKMANKHWVTTRNENGSRGLSFEDYFDDLAKHRYAFSPIGAGLDCHRTWEALYLGTIPVIRVSPAIRSVCRGLPILFVEDWDEATPEFLNERYDDLKAQLDECPKQLNFKYWKDLVKS